MAASSLSLLRRKVNPSILARFQDKQLAATTSAASSSSSHSSAPSPFHPIKSATTQRWAPPAYSLRRQAQLVNEAYADNTLSSLPDGPKKSKLQSRLASASPSSFPDSFFQRLPKSDRKWSYQELRDHQKAIIADLVTEKGPYVGRAQGVAPGRILSGIFKGRKTYRQRPKRERDIAENMADMEARVKEWRSVSRRGDVAQR